MSWAPLRQTKWCWPLAQCCRSSRFPYTDTSKRACPCCWTVWCSSTQSGESREGSWSFCSQQLRRCSPQSNRSLPWSAWYILTTSLACETQCKTKNKAKCWSTWWRSTAKSEQKKSKLSVASSWRREDESLVTDSCLSTRYWEKSWCPWFDKSKIQHWRLYLSLVYPQFFRALWRCRLNFSRYWSRIHSTRWGCSTFLISCFPWDEWNPSCPTSLKLSRAFRCWFEPCV